jgi:hypothetical protein
LRAALGRAFLLLPLPLGYAVLALTAIKALRLGASTQHILLALGALPLGIFVTGTLLALFKRRSPWAGSLALDEHHQLHDRVTTALTFSRLPDGERSAFMQAAIEDALTTVGKLEPRRAVPIRVPRETWVVALLTAALSGLSLLEVRVYETLAPPPAFEAMEMAQDDVELFRELGKELEAKNDDPAALAAVRRFNQLVEDIAQRRLDRRDVFERLGELERELSRSAEIDKEAIDEGLKALARELEKSGLAKPAAEALDQKRLADAEKALRELAEKLRRKQGKPTQAELEKLRQALQKASNTSGERLKNIEERRRELEEERQSLLKKKNKGDAGVPNDDPKLKQNERQLERLDREKQRAERAQKELSKLDKELAEAAQNLMRDAGMSAEDLEQGAQDLNRMGKQEQSDEQKQDLLKRLQELRELLRQQGKGGKDQMQRLMRFGQRARGGKPGSGDQQGQEQGEQSGKGGKKDGPLRLGAGSGGESIPIPGMSQPSSGRSPGGQEPGDAPGGEPGGKQYGSGHDPNVAGEASNLKGNTKDVTAAGVDTGQGTASAEVIYGAAERGFVGKGYKNVYTEYETVAEQALNQDDIPSGYRFYVRRYFQLIRPRE